MRDRIADILFGIILGHIIVLIVSWWFVVPSAKEVATGQAWLEYTSDGAEHWVREKK